MPVRNSLIPLALLVGVTAAILSCRDALPTGVDPRAFSARAASYSDESKPPKQHQPKRGPGSQTPSAWSGLVPCHQAYDSTTRVIGPAGGLIAVGNHILYVDTMTLSDTVSITAVAPADTVRWVRFLPDGLQFRTNGRGWSAFLYTSYRDCAVSDGDPLLIAQVTDSLSVIEYLDSPTWTQPTFVIGVVRHFSQYAISW